jgi:hypothetical protein
MAFTYKGMPIAGAPGLAEAFKITPNNIPPLLVLWLFVTTNQTFFDPGFHQTLTPTAQNKIADALGVTPDTVNFVLTTPLSTPALLGAFQTVAAAFSSIGASGDYSDIFCPNSIDQILTLAPSAQVSDPSQ